jgi:hypothetical protein
MKILRPLALVLALSTAGCILVSGQFIVNFDLGTINVTSPTTVQSKQVDLNDIGDYKDHKSDLKGLADLAVLGVLTNNGSEDIDVEVYMTPDLTSYTTDTDVKGNGVLLWGPFHVPAGQSVRVDWDTSAGLFTPLGKTTLIGEIKGDGQFTVYAVGKAGNYSFTVTEGELVLVLDAGA